MATEPQQDPRAADASRQAFRAMTWAAVALIAIGVLIMFALPGVSQVFRLVIGIVAIVAGLNVFGWASYFRRRLTSPR